VTVWNRRFRSSRRLWLVFSLIAFAVAAYFLRVPVGKDEARLSVLAAAVVSSADDGDAWRYGFPLLLFWGLVLAIPCIGAAWVAQAIVSAFAGVRPRPDAEQVS
jgi:hypothetical protein